MTIVHAPLTMVAEPFLPYPKSQILNPDLGFVYACGGVGGTVGVVGIAGGTFIMGPFGLKML